MPEGDIAMMQTELQRPAPRATGRPAAWADFDAMARIDRSEAVPAHVRLFAGGDRHADPRDLDPELRARAAALIQPTTEAWLVLAEERFDPLHAERWCERLRGYGHAVARCFRAPAAVVERIYAEDARRRGIRAAAARSAHEGALRFEHWLRHAIELGASDLLIRVREEPLATTVQMKVHGAWRIAEQSDNAFGLDLIRAAFAQIRLDERLRNKAAYSPRTDLAGVARFPDVRNACVRLQQMVERNGFSLAVRVLDYEGLNRRYSALADLGYAEDQAAAISHALGRSHGVVLFVGGTGSGKTTALAVAVANSPNFAIRHWVALEDPPELDMPGIASVPVFSEGTYGATGGSGEDPFVAAMRRVLRVSPDGVICGEIRDRETASLTMAMATSGHVAAATLHASEAFLAFRRLTGRELGVDPEVLFEPGVVSLLVAQRLVPVLCDCALPAERRLASRFEEQWRLDPARLRMRNDEGCDRCRSTRPGYAGRTVAAQVVPLTRELLAIARERGLDAARSAWRESREGGFDEPRMLAKTIEEHMLYHVAHGRCDARDLAALA
jgi:type II secretory ATPase GspE/PulE/Tfp pilus assembly ATPase PilB-like protein